MIASPSVWPAGKCSAVDGDVVVEGEDRQSVFGGGLVLYGNRTQVSGCTAFFEALADVIVSDDRGLLLKICVAAGVVAVKVRVDDEPHRLIGDALERGLDLLGEWRVLIVDNHDAIFPHRGTDVASGALQHVDTAGNLGHFDLNLAEVLVLSGDKSGQREKARDREQQSFHKSP